MEHAVPDKRSVTKAPGSRMQGFRKHLWFYMLAAPGIAYFLLFHYVPMWGVLLAFQDYSPYQGVLNSEWVGFAHFRQFFNY